MLDKQRPYTFWGKDKMVMTLLTRPKKTVATVIVATDGSGDYNTDGTADEVEINVALNSLPAGGGVVYMKEGTYNITTSIIIPNDNIEIIGAGASTRIETAEAIVMIYANNVDGISVDKLSLVGGAAFFVLSTGITFDTVINSYIEGCWIVDCANAGIILEDTDKCTVRGAFTYDDGIGISMIGTANHDIIVNNQCYDNDLAGILMGSTTENQSDCIIAHNECLNNGLYGIAVGKNTLRNIAKNN